jgi:hypothetical protein
VPESLTDCPCEPGDRFVLVADEPVLGSFAGFCDGPAGGFFLVALPPDFCRKTVDSIDSVAWLPEFCAGEARLVALLSDGFAVGRVDAGLATGSTRSLLLDGVIFMLKRLE